MALLPQIGLSLDRVRNTLRNPSRYVEVLCVAPNINVWSKYRPVEFDSPASLSEGQRQSVNYGWVIPGLNFNSWVNEVDNWSPVLPSTWKRLDDFCGYQHDSGTPLIIHPATVAISRANIDFFGYYTFVLDDIVLPEGNLSYADLFPDMYFGIFARSNESGQVRAVKTATSKIGTNTVDSRTIRLKVNHLPSETYKFYFFASSQLVATQPESAGFPVAFFGYPLYRSASFPNPVNGSITNALIYPIAVFDVNNDWGKSSNNFYSWTSTALSMSSEDGLFFTDYHSSRLRLVAPDVDGNLVLDTSKTWRFSLDVAITQHYQMTGGYYNLFAVPDIDNMWVSIGLKTIAGSGPLSTNTFIPKLIIDDGASYEFPDIEVDSFSGVVRFEFECYYQASQKRYALNIDDENVFDLPSSVISQLKIEEIIFGANVPMNDAHSALEGFYENIKLELTGEL